MLNHLRRLNLKETEIALNKFAKKVVEDARRNLKVQGLYATGKLSKALGYKFKRSKNSFQFDFTPGYAAYVDKGVSGVKQVRNNTPYSYKDKKPPISAFDKWVLKRFPSETRDESGRFIDRRSMKFALQTHIYNYGIKQSLFFTKPFKKHFNQLESDVIEAFKIDLNRFYKGSFINQQNKERNG